MRLLLFTGHGGAGSTTLAAATAVHAARSGIKTLALALDDARPLSGCLSAPPDGPPREVEPGLFAGGALAGRSRSGLLDGMLEALGVDPVPAGQLGALPGAGELSALRGLRDAVAGPWDLMVLDCGPARSAVRLLALPEAVLACLRQGLPVERRVQRVLDSREAGRSSRAARTPTPARDHLVEAAEWLHAELDPVRELLAGPGTSVRLVLGPQDAGLAAARRAATALALHGYRVDGVLANRVLPADGDDPWRRGWAAAQALVLDRVRQDFAGVPVVTVPDAGAEPVGAVLLAGLGEQVYGPAGPAAASAFCAVPDAGPPAVVPDGDGYELRLPLPFAARREVGLARAGDELVVEHDGQRRSLPLPSGLRRCVVVGARLVDGVLRVRFEPDPQLWRPL